MNKINDTTIETSNEIFKKTNVTPNWKYDIEMNSLMNSYSLKRQYESFQQLNLYIHGSAIDEVYKQNALDENYKKFLLLDFLELNTTETSEIYKNNDQISNSYANIITNSPVITPNQHLQKRYKIIKVLKNCVINTTQTREVYTQTNLKSSCDVDIETPSYVNTSRRTLKKRCKTPVIIDYIDISSASENETYDVSDRNSKYYNPDVETISLGNTSQQTSEEDYENSKYFEIITVSPSEVYGNSDQEYNCDSDVDINSPGNTFNQTTQEKFNKCNVLVDRPFHGFKSITVKNDIKKLNNDPKNLKNKFSNNVNKVYSTLNANEATLSKKCVINKKKTHDRLQVTIGVKNTSASRLSYSKHVSDSSQLSSAPKKRKSEQSKNKGC